MNCRSEAVSLRTWANGNFFMDHHAATYSENRLSSGRRNPVSRAVVLCSESGKLRTIGFPAFRERAKKVWFDPPRPAICTSTEERTAQIALFSASGTAAPEFALKMRAFSTNLICSSRQALGR